MEQFHLKENLSQMAKDSLLFIIFASEFPSNIRKDSLKVGCLVSRVPLSLKILQHCKIKLVKIIPKKCFITKALLSDPGPETPSFN